MLGAAQYDGRPSPQLAARLDHALELYDEGVAPVVMVTGGNQPGDRFTEAEASANYLVDRGVPETAIMREDAGHTTYESLDAAADQLLDAGLDDVVLVTDPYHSLRSRLIAERGRPRRRLVTDADQRRDRLVVVPPRARGGRREWRSGGSSGSTGSAI